MTVRTHTFNGRKYKITQVDSIDGCTDVPGDPEELEMMILDGDDLRALHSVIHEGAEGSGMCDCIHRYEIRNDGRAATWDIARLAWRLGWRRVHK